MKDVRKPRPVKYLIRNFGNTRVFEFNGICLNIYKGQEIETEDFGFAKFMNCQYMVQVTKKTSGLPL